MIIENKWKKKINERAKNIMQKIQKVTKNI